ncbi:hypothetical protein KQX54_017286, partial [Cotesia glomerata]
RNFKTAVKLKILSEIFKIFALIFWPNKKKTSIIHSTLINKRLEFNRAIVSWGRKFLSAVIIAENENIDWLESLVVNTNGIITGSEQSCLKKNTCSRTASENMLSNTDICAGVDVVADANCDTHFNVGARIEVDGNIGARAGVFLNVKFSVDAGDDGSSNVVAEDDVCPTIGVDASSDAGADVGADIKVDNVDASAIANIIGGANIIADIETENDAGAGSNVGTDIGVEDVGAGADVGANIEVEYNVGALADVSTKADVVGDIRAEDDIRAGTSAGAGAGIIADIGAEDDFDADIEAKDVVGAEADVGANAGVEDDAGASARDDIGGVAGTHASPGITANADSAIGAGAGTVGVVGIDTGVVGNGTSISMPTPNVKYVKLIEGSNVLVNSLDLEDIQKFRNKPKEITRRLLKSLLGDAKLKQMTLSSFHQDLN